MGTRPALRLKPFRALRYDARVVGDLALVTSPPYDVMDRSMIDTLLAQHPRNIVRLTLPRLVCDPLTTEDPYERAKNRMIRWRAKGVLRPDDENCLYVYEYGDAAVTVCGLIGAVGLEPPEAGVVLPHEDVIEPIVDDRLAMMRAMRANLEPILLVYDGGGATKAMIEDAKRADPVIDIDASDGTRHRLWRIDDDATIDDIGRLLAPHEALIADGHHRYAAYLRLQAETSTRAFPRGRRSGAWDYGLALLVDQSEWPLELKAIHRSDPELALADILAPDGELSLSDVDIEAAELEDLPTGATGDSLEPSGPGEIVVTDGRQLRRLRRLDSDPAVTDAEVLHERLLPLWRVDEDRIGFHHTSDQAIRSARQDGGVAILLHPTTVSQVMDVAKAGKVMPRKSTSFGPKPRTGFVMRAL